MRLVCKATTEVRIKLPVKLRLHQRGELRLAGLLKPVKKFLSPHRQMWCVANKKACRKDRPGDGVFQRNPRKALDPVLC